jgi:hypothetical protein
MMMWRQVDAVKRQCVRELPQHLILHLKRFEFDFDTLRRKKLNDRCVIPERLNMKPFTEEGIAAKEAEVCALVRPLVITRVVFVLNVRVFPVGFWWKRRR